MKPDLAIVYTPVGAGHKAAAMATAEAARARGLCVEVLDLFALAPSFVARTYLTAHFGGQSVAPRLYGSAYFGANHRDGAFEPVRRGFDHIVFSDLVTTVCAMRPRAVVATHHLPLVVLGRARLRGKLDAPLLGVVTDYTAHAVWAERGVDAFCVACPLARDELVMHGIRPEAIEMTGIPIRPDFGATPRLVEPKSGEALRVLVTSGGFGIGPIRAIVRSFAGVPDVELTIVCGAATRRIPRIERDAQAAGIRARVLGFERDMPSRLAQAHVVVGKAGGLTVTETMAAGRPMVFVGTVPGNEWFNEERVVRGGAGYAAQAGEVGATVDAMRSRGEMARMGERGRRLVLAGSAGNVVEVVRGWIAKGGQRAA
jgi:processive 1,2-diacylglycerol beta-glucosyltransferase